MKYSETLLGSSIPLRAKKKKKYCMNIAGNIPACARADKFNGVLRMLVQGAIVITICNCTTMWNFCI